MTIRRRIASTAETAACRPPAAPFCLNGLKRAFERLAGHPQGDGANFDAVAFNEGAPEAAVDVFNDLQLAFAANVSAVGAGKVSDEGLLSVPFGDWPVDAVRKDGTTFKCVQRIDAQAVNELNSGFRGILQKLQFWLVKVPVFEGHPDKVAALNEQQMDDLTRGTVKAISAGTDRMEFAVAWNEAGKAVVGGYVANSPRWLLKETGETTRDGLPVMRPCLLVSIGLTNKPNIAGSAINEEETTQENPKMKELIAKLRQELKLAADLSDEEVLRRGQEHYSQILDELWSVRSKLEEAARLKADAETAAAKAQADIAAAQAATAAANERATTAETALATAQAAATAANEAQATAAAGIVDAAITAGKIPLADRQSWLDRFAANPLEAAAAAANEAPRLKTEEGPAAAANERREQPALAQFQAAVAEHMKTHGLTGAEGYNAAYNACRKSHAAIYAQLKGAL